MIHESSLWAVRHAPVDAEGLCYGQHDVPAIKAPELAATEVLGALPARIDTIWSSPLSRCHDLAVCIAKALSVPLRVDQRLLEISFGAWEGRSWEDIQRSDAQAFSGWMQDWMNIVPPGGESVLQLRHRVEAWYRALLSEPDAQGVHLAVAHAGVIRALRVIVEGADWRSAMRRSVPHLAPIQFSPSPADLR